MIFLPASSGDRRARGNTVAAALSVAFVLVAAVAVLGFIGYRMRPKSRLQHTRERLESGVRESREHVYGPVQASASASHRHHEREVDAPAV